MDKHYHWRQGFFFESMFRSGPDAILLVDREGKIADANAVALEQLSCGITLVGRAFVDMVDVSVDKTVIELHVARAMQGQYATIDTYFRGDVCASGKRNMRLSLIPSGDKSLAIPLAVVCRAVDSRNDLNRTDKLSLTGQLAAGIAHEIRNPLTALKGFNQLLTEEANPKHLRFHQIMKKELDHIEHILSGLLALARPNEPTFLNHSLDEIVQGVVELMEGHAFMRNVQISCALTPGFGFAFCDVVQLTQVFVNCLKNGIEAMPSGGRIEINGYLDDCAGIAKIEFADEGVGMSPETIAHLGQPFFTTKSAGTGLGLAMCQQLLKRHGGWMTFDSTPGRGTTVTVCLPAKAQRLSSED